MKFNSVYYTIHENIGWPIIKKNIRKFIFESQTLQDFILFFFYFFANGVQF